MARVPFQARIDQNTQNSINKYIEYVNVKNDFKINPGDVHRAIVQKGIEALIEKEGGLSHIQQVINKNIENDIENGLITPMVEFENLSIAAEIEAGEKFNKKYNSDEIRKASIAEKLENTKEDK